MTDRTNNQEIVYLASSKSSPKKYHTNRDCADLQRALRVREVPLNHLHDDKEECSRCAGNVKRTSNPEDYVSSLKEAAKDPDEDWP